MNRNGKIARLPRTIREELNHRLQRGEQGEPLLGWLNPLPEVQAILVDEFAGVAVSKQNLSEWRKGGFVEWEFKGDYLQDSEEMRADAEEIGSATNGRQADHLATVLTARYASLVRTWNGEVTAEFQLKLKVLQGMIQNVSHLRRWDHNAAKVQMEQELHETKREKSEEELVEHFERWIKLPAVHDWICQTWKTPVEREQEKRRLLGRKPLTEAEIARMEGSSKDQPPTSKEEGPGQSSQGAPVHSAPASASANPPMESNPVKPSQTILTKGDSADSDAGKTTEVVQEMVVADTTSGPIPDAPASLESNPVKPGQTTLTDPKVGPAAPNVSGSGEPSGGQPTPLRDRPEVRPTIVSHPVKGDLAAMTVPGEPEVPGGMLWGKGSPPELRPYRPTLCKGKCDLVEGICQGCRRTADEIAKWPLLTPECRHLFIRMVLERQRRSH